MDNIKTLMDENKCWHRDHVKWLEEVEQWERETQRLVAMLYLMERSLPNHSAMLKKHVSLIEQRKQHIDCYSCELDERCFPECPTSMTLQQNDEFRQKLSRLHAEAKQRHTDLKQTYAKEMEKFRSLATRLLEGC